MSRRAGVVAAALFLALAGAARAGDDVLARRVQALTAPALAGRGSGSPGGRAAADTLVAWLREAGLAPAFAGLWRQCYDLEGEGWAGQSLVGARGCNVAGILPGRGVLADRWVVAGAHYDHLGRVEPASPGAPPPAPGAYYPGANDNASGVAALLEAVRGLAPPEDPARGLIVVFFGDEETGLQGSSRFVQDPPVPLEAVDVMVNLDTVGNLMEDELSVSGVGTSPPLRELALGAAEDLPVVLADGGWSGSDHMVFNTREVPVLFLFGGAYPEYNRPGDTWEKLVPGDLARVRDYARRLLAALRVAPGPFPWRMVGDGSLRADDAPAENAQHRATWLGTLPDFTGEDAGYRLAGVFDGSPAARAGLQKGDVLVRLGGRAVTDLATFTRALRAHPPGTPVEIEARRGGALLRFTVILGDRADRR